MEMEQNAVHFEYLDGILITVKKLSVECWTLLTLSGCHLGYIAEGAEPSTYENGGRGCSGCCKLSLISP